MTVPQASKGRLAWALKINRSNARVQIGAVRKGCFPSGVRSNDQAISHFEGGASRLAPRPEHQVAYFES